MPRTDVARFITHLQFDAIETVDLIGHMYIYAQETNGIFQNIFFSVHRLCIFQLIHILAPSHFLMGENKELDIN